MSDQADKELPASERKIQKAKTEGNVPRSKELTSGVVLLTALATLYFSGPSIASNSEAIFKKAFTLDSRHAFDTKMIEIAFVEILMESLVLLAPLFVAVSIGAILSGFALSGINFSTKSLEPKLSKLNPIKGFKNIFGANALAELLKALLKTILIGGLGVYLVIQAVPEFSSFSALSPIVASARALDMLLLFLIISTFAFLLVVGLDIPYQIYTHLKNLRMDYKEMKDEHKQSEGDPYIKAKIRQIQRQMALNRMMTDIPESTVIITNPTHYAVALKYKHGEFSAPQLIGKGKNLIAQRIREIGKHNSIPIVEIPALARAIHESTPIGAVIHKDLFSVVAKLLAYVYELEKGKEIKELFPLESEVPQELDPENPHYKKKHNKR